MFNSGVKCEKEKRMPNTVQTLWLLKRIKTLRNDFRNEIKEKTARQQAQLPHDAAENVYEQKKQKKFERKTLKVFEWKENINPFYLDKYQIHNV